MGWMDFKHLEKAVVILLVSMHCQRTSKKDPLPSLYTRCSLSLLLHVYNSSCCFTIIIVAATDSV